MNSLARSVLDAALLKHGVSAGQICSPTTWKQRWHDADAMARTWASLSQSLPGLRRETFHDFYRCNKDTVDALELFGQHPHLTYAPATELNDLFDTGGWPEFNERFPGSHGIMETSQPGFANDKRQALIILGEQVHYMMGSGRYYMCDYNGTRWQAISDCPAWRS
jgi:hypothetical protein